MNKQKLKLVVAATAALIAQIALPAFSGVAQASPPQFSQSYIRLDRMAAAAVTGGTVCATPSTTGVEAALAITFPVGFGVNSTPANWVVDSTNLPAGSTFWLGMTTGVTTASAVTLQTVTFPSGDLVQGTQYCFHFAAVLTNGSVGDSQQGIIHTLDGTLPTPLVIEETNFALSIIANDQITVSAIVPPTFVFALSGNADTFPSDLDPANIKSTAGLTASVTTNAKGGWIGWVKDSEHGLFSASAAYLIPTSGVIDGAPSTLATHSEGYVLDADLTTDAAGGCTVNIDPEYDGAGITQGGTLSTSFQPFAACTGAAPATSNGDVVTLIERASIAGGTPAGSDYSDIITVVAAGNF